MLGLAALGGWYWLAYKNESQNGKPVPPPSGKPASGASAHSPEYRFAPIETKPRLSDPMESNSDDQRRLDSLFRSIELDGKPKREQGIVELRSFLQSKDPQVRLNAATMLYEMKDRSGYSTLLTLLSSPQPIPGKGGLDLRESAARTLARYREHWADNALLTQYEKTKSLELASSASILRMNGMVPYLHESLKQRLWYTSMADLAILEPQNNKPLFKQISENEQATPKQRAAAMFGLARSGDEAGLDRLMAVATNAREALRGNHDDAYLAQARAVTYLTNFRGERMVKFFEDVMSGKYQDSPRSIALVYLRYRYPQNQPSREVVKAGLQPGGASLDWDYTLLLRLARLSGDPELIALGKQTDYFTSFRELDVRAGWSNAWIGEILPDWEGDW